jgi:hypothetical protein
LCAGTAGGQPAGLGTVHAVDGDGASFCDLVPAVELVPIDGLPWPDVPLEHRCSACQLLASVDDGNPGP